MNTLERLMIGLVPNFPTNRFATKSGNKEPIPANPIINPQTANETPICSMISGIRGIKVIATKPWVKKKTESAVWALLSLAGGRGTFATSFSQR
jgi:hypothetical protein